MRVRMHVNMRVEMHIRRLRMGTKSIVKMHVNIGVKNQDVRR